MTGRLTGVVPTCESTGVSGEDRLSISAMYVGSAQPGPR
jgi:hypothetical protein